MRMIINDQTNIQDSSLLECMPRYVEVLSRINKCKDEEIIIDLSKVRFAYPLFLNLLLLLRDAQSKRIRFENSTTYLDSIHFPNAIKKDNLSHYEAKKAFLPLIVSMPESEDDSVNTITSSVMRLVQQNVELPVQVNNALRYMLQEIIDNVGEHSQASQFYTLVQVYPKKKLIDICIADNGRGLRSSYRKAAINVKSDLAAMQLMASAISSKDRNKNESRGYGLFTSRKMTVEGLEGEFVLVSGKAAYAKKAEKEFLLSLPECNTKGTVVALRLHYDKPAFDMYKYLEY